MKTDLHHVLPAKASLLISVLLPLPYPPDPHNPIRSPSLIISFPPANLFNGDIMEINSHVLRGPLWPCLSLLTCLTSNPTAVTLCLSNTSLLCVAVTGPAGLSLGEQHSSSRDVTALATSSYPGLCWRVIPQRPFLMVFLEEHSGCFPSFRCVSFQGCVIVCCHIVLWICLFIVHFSLLPHPPTQPPIKI